jgi:hypothetical protein
MTTANEVFDKDGYCKHDRTIETCADGCDVLLDSMNEEDDEHYD